MGIIGVVAALTVPNLNSSTGDKEKVAKVKKIYQNLNDAFGRAEAVYGPYETWCINDDARRCGFRKFERLLDFLKTSKKCDSVTTCEMLFEENGSALSLSSAVVLADGSVIGLYLGSGGIRDDRCAGDIYIDIDGVKKGKNLEGSDTFCFKIDGDRGVYAGKSDWNLDYVFGSDERFCCLDATAWIINFDNMDYLKADYNGKCPDGKTKLTFSGNHTCK